MRILYKGLFVYLGWNGIIIDIEFKFKNKWHSLEFMLGHYSARESELI